MMALPCSSLWSRLKYLKSDPSSNKRHSLYPEKESWNFGDSYIFSGTSSRSSAHIISPSGWIIMTLYLLLPSSGQHFHVFNIGLQLTIFDLFPEYFLFKSLVYNRSNNGEKHNLKFRAWLQSLVLSKTPTYSVYYHRSLMNPDNVHNVWILSWLRAKWLISH